MQAAFLRPKMSLNKVPLIKDLAAQEGSSGTSQQLSHQSFSEFPTELTAVLPRLSNQKTQPETVEEPEGTLPTTTPTA